MIKNYIKDHKKVIIFFVIAILIFLIIIRLYKLPLEAVGYAALLCLVLAFIFLIYDFYFYRKRNKELVRMMVSITETMDGMPIPKTLTEENWNTLVTMSHGVNLENKNEFNNTITEMMDYYTMWVHQVKTPIAAMRLLLQSSDENISAALKKDLNSELFKIEQYCEMVLSYMRLESNSTDYVFKEYDLDSIIKQTVKKYSVPFINKKISLDYEDTGLSVLTDEKWLGFALEQILSNAVKYTDSGSVSIRKATFDEINTSKSNIGDDYSDDCLVENNVGKYLVIEDTGIGIASADLPRVFEKGYTGYNGRVNKKSTGIGLFLTKKILTKLGHSIEIYSEPGHGTKVILDLNNIEYKYD